MGQKFALWRYGTGAAGNKQVPASLPDWMYDDKLYKGLYGVGSQKMAYAPGVKVTRGFNQALCHAIAALAGISYDGGVSDVFAENDDYLVAQYVNSVEFNSLVSTVTVDSLGMRIRPNSVEVVSCVFEKTNKKFYMHSHMTSSVFTSDAAMLFTLMPILWKNDDFHNEMDWFVNRAKVKSPLDDAELKFHLVAIARAAKNATDSYGIPEQLVINDLPESIMANPRYQTDYAFGSKPFKYLPKANNHGKSGQQSTETPENFAGKYSFGRKLTAEQEANVPVLSDRVVIPPLADTVCRMIHDTTGRPRTVRNVFLFGPTGTGKSKMAEIIAAGLHEPYAALNCNPDTSNIDLLVSVMPADDGEKLNLDGYDGLPTLSEMEWQPDEAWFKMSGEKKDDATYEDCLNLGYEKITGRKEQGITPVEFAEAVAKRAISDAEAKTGQRYIYVESPLVKAMREGGVVELMELNTIVQAGVLAGLNSVLDDNGFAFLPQGKVIRRHPNCIIIATANVAYEGCRRLNQSFLRRFQFKAYIPSPPKNQMIARIKAMIGFSKDDFVTEDNISKMVDTMTHVKGFCKENDLTDGDIGICEVADWANTANILHSIRDAADYTIIPSATQNVEDREDIEKIIAEHFL